MLSVGLLDPAQQASRIRADAGQVGKRYSLPQAVQLGSQQLQVAALRYHHDRLPGRHARLHIRDNTSGVFSRSPVEERSVHEVIRVDRSCVLHYLTPTCQPRGCLVSRAGTIRPLVTCAVAIETRLAAYYRSKPRSRRRSLGTGIRDANADCPLSGAANQLSAMLRPLCCAHRAAPALPDGPVAATSWGLPGQE